VIWVTTPPEYATVAPGQYCWTQLFENFSKQNVNNAGWVLLPNPPSTEVNSGTWLDRSHAYPLAGWFNASGKPATPISDTFQPFYRDMPGFGDPDNPSDYLHPAVTGSGLQSYGMQYIANFHLYVMYDPPPGSGGVTAEVPLRVRNWDAWGQFVWTSPSNWSAPLDNSVHGTPSPYPPHPIWTKRHI
jgi:hypothetical protein